MKAVNTILATVALTIGMMGTASAVECEEAPVRLESASMHLESAEALIEQIGFKKRRMARRELRQAVRDLFRAQRALAHCGILPFEIVLEEAEISWIDPFNIVFDVEVNETGGQFANEFVLGAARMLAIRSIKETYGTDDGDALTEIQTAIKLIYMAEGNL